jgi:predicted transcriptional regulator of viral defense system
MDESADDIHPDMRGLFEIASGQMGHFTTAQAREQGFHGNLISYHVKTGRFIRIHRGVYRFRDYPSSPREDVMAAWLAVGKEKAVISHESALDLLELSDVIPNAIHLTVPRSSRGHSVLPGVRLHTVSEPIAPRDLRSWDGMRHTSAERTIVDAAEFGTDIVQVHKAIGGALTRGITTPRRLEEGSQLRNKRVRQIIHEGLRGSRP